MTAPDHRILETKPVPVPRQDDSSSPFTLPSERADTRRLDALEGDKHLISIKATIGGWVFERTIGFHTHVNNGNAGLRNAIDLAFPQPQETKPEVPAEQEKH